ncbi:MAG: helix-turn-helix transcriptional regulator [Clostridia bacterium]|nr:helix-turn-helix transcriptional regulator [Clostridia bacterium]
MQNRSFFPVHTDVKQLPADYPVLFQSYTQRWHAQPSLHTHNCLELGLCTRGVGSLFIGGVICPFEAGSVQIIQPGCLHDSQVLMNNPDEPPSEWLYIFADADALGMWQGCSGSFTVKREELAFLFRLLYTELAAQAEGWQAQARRLMESLLCMAGRFAPCTPAPAPQSHEMTAILHYILLNYASDLTVEKLARRCLMSVSHFRRLFTAHTGMGPQQYMIHVRLSMAEQLLRQSKKPILAISEEVGFKSLSSFNRLFHKAYGCSPRQLRAQPQTNVQMEDV